MAALPPIKVPVIPDYAASLMPTVGRIVHYRLTRDDCDAISRRRRDAHTHRQEHRDNATGVQVHVGNDPLPGDVVPLLVVRVWPDEYRTDASVARDRDPGDEPIWFFPKSTFGVNGQAILDGNDTLWVTSAPQGGERGCWDWPLPAAEGRS